jgi:pyrimidine-nucleoside phosphorylase
MLVYELVKKKRDGETLSPEEIRFLIEGYVAGRIPDYQMAAFLMAVFFRGMETQELATWTEAMIGSGEVITFDGAGPYLDKHSTGGVGDKVSLPLAPLLACMDIRVPMISGRGLGHTGGTLDKLDSIPGFRTNLSVAEFRRVVEEVGCCISGQTAALVPSDKKMYALRDVTATVDSIPLIASSILSKKKASGISGLLMDVKTGSGAFMKTEERSRALATAMVGLGKALGLTVRAFITEMGQPLGVWAGNAVEIVETIDVLAGRGPEDTTALVVRFAAEMMVMGGKAAGVEEGSAKVRAAIADGRGLAKLAQMVEAQGGDPKVVDDPSRLPLAKGREAFRAPRAGFVQSMDCEKMGQAVVALGGGRLRMEDSVDFAVGLEIHRKLGDAVAQGEPLVTVRYSDAARLPQAQAMLGRAYVISDEPAGRPLLVKAVI